MLMIVVILVLAGLACGWWVVGEIRATADARAAADRALSPLKQTLDGLRNVAPGTRDGRPLVDLYGEFFAWLGHGLARFGLEGRAEVPRAAGVVDLARTFAPTEWAQIKTIDVTVTFTQWRYYRVVALIAAATQQFPAVQRSLVLAPNSARLVLTLYGRV